MVSTKNSKIKILQVAVFIFICQVGSGVFLLPSVLSVGGYRSLVVLLVVGILCTLLAKIFAETGKNSHELITDAFGARMGKIFFLVYWILSWVGTVVCFRELIGYLNCSQLQGLSVEMLVWALVIGFNMWNFKSTIYLETALGVLKLTPFLGLLVGFLLSPRATVHSIDSLNLSLFLKCLWCFVGLETGNIIGKTLNANLEERPRGTALGMALVLSFYVIGVFFCFCISGTNVLYCNKAPYVTVFQDGLGGYLPTAILSNIIKLAIVIVLLGSINTWVIGSGYIGYEGGMIGALPGLFKKINKNKVPYMSVFLFGICLLILLLLSHNPNIYASTMYFIDVSCCFLLLIYAMCIWSYSKIYLILIKKKIYYGIAILFLLSFVYSLFCIIFS